MTLNHKQTYIVFVSAILLSSLLGGWSTLIILTIVYCYTTTKNTDLKAKFRERI